VLLHLGPCVEVKLFDKVFEFLTISVKVFEVLRVNVVLIVELGNFFLGVEFLIIIVVIVNSVEFLEQCVFFLTFLRLGEFLPLFEEERKSKHLLEIRSQVSF
jgi:hypothetical protein